MRGYKKRMILSVTAIVIASGYAAGCSSQPNTKTVPVAAASPAAAQEKVENIKMIGIAAANFQQDSNQFIVNVTLKNESVSAQTIKPELFALVIDNTILSPNSKSSVPGQVPANTTAQIKLTFDNKDIDGKHNVRLGFQPSNSAEPQQFFSFNNIDITAPKADAKPAKTESSVSRTNISLQQKTGLELVTVNAFGISVKVPKGWKRGSNDGGDFAGYKYINPDDPNQQMIIVSSTCAGCGYPDADFSALPDPKSLIPHEYPTGSFVFHNGFSAGYAYYENGNPYPGNGVVSMRPGYGYGFAEIILPESKKSFASNVLNSFKFHGAY